MHLRLYVMRAAVVVFLLFGASCIAQTPEMEKQSAEIVGEVIKKFSEHTTMPGYAGRTLPKTNFPIYLFDWQHSVGIRGWLNKLEKDIQAATNAKPHDSDKWWIVEKRTEDAYKMITHAFTPRRTKTDDEGRFAFKNLKPGEKYLVVTTDQVYEVGIVLLYEIVGPLKLGKNKVRLVHKN